MEDIMQNLKPNTVHVDVNIDKEMTNAKKYIVENFFGYSAITLPLKLDGNTDYDFLMATDGKSINSNYLVLLMQDSAFGLSYCMKFTM